MARMGLSAEHRQEAIALFKRGAQPEFDTEAQITRFMTQCGAHPSLRQMLLMLLFSTAAADGTMAPGRLIVTGMGKAGIIGQKVSATLASTDPSELARASSM